MNFAQRWYFRPRALLTEGGQRGVQMSASDSRKHRGPYAKSIVVRQRIVEAAAEVFSELGYWATTMKAIAVRANISQRGLVHHFAAKDELLAAVIEWRDHQSADLMAPADGSVDAFASMMAVVADNMRRPGLAELYTVLTAEAASEEHPAHQHYCQRYQLLRQYFAIAFEAARERGDLVSPLAADALAVAFIALIDGVQLQWLYDRSIDPEPVLRAFLGSVLPGYPESK